MIHWQYNHIYSNAINIKFISPELAECLLSCVKIVCNYHLKWLSSSDLKITCFRLGAHSSAQFCNNRIDWKTTAAILVDVCIPSIALKTFICWLIINDFGGYLSLDIIGKKNL